MQAPEEFAPESKKTSNPKAEGKPSLPPEPNAPKAEGAQKRMDELQGELEAQKEKTLRALADLDNSRRGFQRKSEKIRRDAEIDITRELLPVIDHCNQGLALAPQAQSVDEVIQGLEAILTQLQKTLSQRGLEAIDPKPSEIFNPHLHDAVQHENHTEIPEGHIIKILRCGYQLGSQLLRAASVTVSSGPEAMPEADEKEQSAEPNLKEQ